MGNDDKGWMSLYKLAARLGMNVEELKQGLESLKKKGLVKERTKNGRKEYKSLI